MKRTFLAALLACVVLFLWGGLSHTVLLIGTGFTPLPQEETIVPALSGSIKAQGLYFFPGKDFRHATAEQEADWLTRFRTGPTGMVIYRPVGGEPFSARKLLIQLLASFVTALIASYVASLMGAPYWERALAISLFGFMACSAVSIIYWNWYEFPTSFFIAQIVDQAIGFFLAGLVIARIAPRRQPAFS